MSRSSPTRTTTGEVSTETAGEEDGGTDALAETSLDDGSTTDSEDTDDAGGAPGGSEIEPAAASSPPVAPEPTPTLNLIGAQQSCQPTVVTRSGELRRGARLGHETRAFIIGATAEPTPGYPRQRLVWPSASQCLLRSPALAWRSWYTSYLTPWVFITCQMRFAIASYLSGSQVISILRCRFAMPHRIPAFGGSV